MKKLIKRLLNYPDQPSQPGRLRDSSSYIDCTTTVDVLLKHCKPAVLFDIGAHNGNWSRIVLETLGVDISIVMFEPQKKSFDGLMNFYGKQKNKNIFNVALGSISGKSTIKGGGASASLLSATDLQNATFPNSFNENETEEVQVFTLDEFIVKNNLQLPDVIKIDVQGFELDVFKGAATALISAKYLVVELSLISLYKDQPSLSELLDFLDTAGFKLVDFGYQWRNAKGEIIQIDAIFKRNNC